VHRKPPLGSDSMRRWQLALGWLSWTAASGNWHWACFAGLTRMAARGNPHWACSAGRQRVATCTGLAPLDGRQWQRVATRIGLAQLNGRKWQQVAARSGLAQLDVPGADRSKPTSCGPQQWRVNPDREHGRVDRVDRVDTPRRAPLVAATMGASAWENHPTRW